MGLVRIFGIAAVLAPAWLGLCAGAAKAQASVTVSAESDYRLRGVSLTNGGAAVRAGVAYDHPSGGYAGAAVVLGERARGRVAALGHVAYAGYARRLASGTTVDAGFTHSRIVGEVPYKLDVTVPGGYVYSYVYRRRYAAEYAEAYAGLIRDNFSAHLYLSPRYLEPGRKTAYLDLNASTRVRPNLRLFAHAGALATLAGGVDRRTRFDAKAGAALSFGPGELQVAWSGVSRQVDYPVGYPQDRSAVVVSATLSF